MKVLTGGRLLPAISCFVCFLSIDYTTVRLCCAYALDLHAMIHRLLKQKRRINAKNVKHCTANEMLKTEDEEEKEEKLMKTIYTYTYGSR